MQNSQLPPVSSSCSSSSTAQQMFTSVVGAAETETKENKASAVSKPMFDHLCKVCDEPATSHCGRCKAIYYCTPFCQKEDWKTHKINCKAMGSSEALVVTLKPKLKECKDGLDGTPVPENLTEVYEDALETFKGLNKDMDKLMNDAQLTAIRDDELPLPIEEVNAKWARVPVDKFARKPGEISSMTTAELEAAAAALKDVVPATNALKEAAQAKSKELEKTINLLDKLMIRAMVGERLANHYKDEIEAQVK